MLQIGRHETVEHTVQMCWTGQVAAQAHEATAHQAEATAAKLRQQLESTEGTLQALQQQSVQQAQQAKGAVRQAQDDRDAAAKLSAELDAKLSGLQSQLASAEEMADAVQSENERLKGEMHAAQATLDQAKADKSISESAASQKMQALEKSLQQAEEVAVAESFTMAKRDSRAAQAAEATGHLEQAHRQIQQLQAALKEAQEHTRCSEDSRKAAVQVGALPAEVLLACTTSSISCHT